MTRPRIRSVKPEMWQDENVGDLCHGARLLLVGLITMADDEGRLRALPTLILGHVFPYDEVSPAKLRRWLGEIEGAGLILRYEDGGKPYIAFRHWARHQKINRPNASLLPAPNDPEVVRANSLKEQGDNKEPTGSPPESFTPPRAGAGSDPIPSDPVVAVLDRVAFSRNVSVKVAAAEKVCKASDLDPAELLGQAEKFEHYWTDGPGEKKPLKDVAWAFRNWIERVKPGEVISIAKAPTFDPDPYEDQVREFQV